MTSFEFFTVLLSFVISLGVASLLQSVIHLIQEAPRVRFSLAWALWAAAIFNLQVIFWLRAWGYNDDFTLRMATSIPPLALAIIAFFACGLATPRIADEGPIDLEAFHFQQGRKYQVAYAVFMLAAILQGAVMNTQPLFRPGFWFDAGAQLTMALACIICAIFQRTRWIQITIPALLLASSLAYYGSLMEQ